MTIKKIALSSAVILTAAASSFAANAADTIRIATEGAWAPFNTSWCPNVLWISFSTKAGSLDILVTFIDDSINVKHRLG